jgi:hypothetical protein
MWTTRCALAGVIMLAALLVSGCSPEHALGEVAASPSLTRPTPAGQSFEPDLYFPAHGRGSGNLIFSPVDIAPGGEFIVDVLGRDGGSIGTLARVIHHGLTSARHRMEVDFTGASTNAFDVRLRLHGLDVSELTNVALPIQRSLAGAGGTVGEAAQQPTSFHYQTYTQNGQTLVRVVVDYEDGARGGGGSTPFTSAVGPSDANTVSHVMISPSAGLNTTGVTIEGVRLHGSGIGPVTVSQAWFE